MRIQRLDANTRQNLLEDLLKRSPNNYGEYEKGVAEILARVKREKDEAVFEYTRKFDQAVISAANIKVTEDEIKEAYELADPALVEIIRKALKNIEAYHEKQRQYSWFDSKPDGTMLGQKVTPLKRVGVYVPGGKAVYPSSVLMNIMPAKVAGVEEIIMVTPPDKDGKVTPNTLVAAHEAGATAIYKVGGAQAIGALAYGTQSIPKVDKIVGPGNIYVALAKKAVYGHVSIDGIAGKEMGKIKSAINSINQALKNKGLYFNALANSKRRNNSGGPYIPDRRNLVKDKELDDKISKIFESYDDLEYYREVVQYIPIGKPVWSYWVTSQYGSRSDPFNGKRARHKGMDLASRTGNKIKVKAKGKVTRAEYAGGYGNLVVVDHGNGFQTKYAHMNKIYVKKGQYVEYDETLGEVGTTDV